MSRVQGVQGGVLKEPEAAAMRTMAEDRHVSELEGSGNAADTHRAEVGKAFAHLVASRELDLPLPGSGNTLERWRALTALARRDLSLARLCEGHADALAILHELSAMDAPGLPGAAYGARWGVWAAEPPGPGLNAENHGADGWRLSGRKPYCSGAQTCTHALVTARDGETRRLFAVAVEHAALRPARGSWPAAGMAGSDTLDIDFDSAVAQPVGGPDAYVRRPGFWHGGIGVAACWYGGALEIAARLLDAMARRGPDRQDPHGLAHLGAVGARLEAVDALLERAATEVDADPHDREGRASLRAMRVRAAVEDAVGDVTARVGRALGAGPLGHDHAHARHVTDLTVYVRQHHGERDLAALGERLLPERSEQAGQGGQGGQGGQAR